MITASEGSGTAKTSTMIRVRPPAVRMMSLIIVQLSRNAAPAHRHRPTLTCPHREYWQKAGSGGTGNQSAPYS